MYLPPHTNQQPPLSHTHTTSHVRYNTIRGVHMCVPSKFEIFSHVIHLPSKTQLLKKLLPNQILFFIF